ncbi:glycerol acyltransferase [Desulfonema ishimotonii]|uniref:Glycerol acyltransferase n=1 Tax=Desulfonema ishimotonii TaxID=45657 RepID=A0A401FVU1_9BACT|nr:alpha/beta fold hydrolase [Desulfonema ishimotonii]GBC61080.1 glycerol acyltransferase [Desulfonema ishimotonii]
MNHFAYLTTSLAIKTLSGLSKANISIHGQENIPEGAKIFTINHFTRLETLFLPCYIYDLTGNTPVWSLADYTLFKGGLKRYLDRVGAISTRDPDRDLLIVKTLLTGEAAWIIFPEGRMVKNKKIFDRGRFLITHERGKRPPHTGAATLAIRTEYFRQRIRFMAEREPETAKRLTEIFQLSGTGDISPRPTSVVPVNVTYYPLRARENIISRMAANWFDDLPDRAVEEMMTEGTMLLSGVDVDIRFGPAIDIRAFMAETGLAHMIPATAKGRDEAALPPRRQLRKAARKLMQRHMGAIYQGTTVNHDHLFASVLKQMPYKTVDPDDLRRRVFLAANLDFDGMGIFCHNSLESDQIHLITDDRYQKAGQFMETVLEKRIVLRTARGLEKNRAFFSSLLDFHHIRLDNPVSVMANEVEPLTPLQREIRRLAWLPPFLIRRRTVKYLLRRAIADFESDYETFYSETESKPGAVGMPFFVRGETREIGVLLIHGYMAAPMEMADLAIYLGRRGVRLYVPRLRGHGTSPRDLATRTYGEWVASVDAGYAVIRNQCKKVFVGGFSTGAALALDLAARVDDIDGVFAVCPPRRLQDPSLRRNLAKDIWARLVDKVRGGEGIREEFIENLPENPHISYSRNPVSGIREVELLIDALEPKLSRIRIPALVIHSRRDPVADWQGSRRIFEMIGSEEKQYVLFNFDRHSILSGRGAHRVHRTIDDFIGDP